MKTSRIILTMTLTALFTIFPWMVKAEAATLYGTVQKIPSPSEGSIDLDPDLNPEGNRTPSIKIPIVISGENGLQIPNVDNADILLYEVIDNQGVMLATFTSEWDFVNFVLTDNTCGGFRLHLPDYILRGII